jgi:hydrogenase assembly chaperone HypC/HupF
MCLAVPSKIIGIDNLIATIDTYGAHGRSAHASAEEPKVGDYVLVHAGFAIRRSKETVESGEICMKHPQPSALISSSQMPEEDAVP